MAHEVILDIATKFVLHKDVKIEVRANDKRLGSLLVSKGNIEWVPSGNSVNKSRLTWTKFAALMEAEGKPVKAPTVRRAKRVRLDTERQHVSMCGGHAEVTWTALPWTKTKRRMI